MQKEGSFDSLLSIANPMSGKTLFWRFCPKCSWPIRLQDSLKSNIFKKLRNQLDFLFADKHKSFLQVDFTAFGGRGQACPKYPK